MARERSARDHDARSREVTMTKRTTIAVLALCAFGCGSSGGANADGNRGGGAGMPGTGGGPNPPDPGPMCTPTADSESTCTGGVDEDCDGFTDCLDSECDGQACGAGLTCAGGACRKPCESGDSGCVPELPPLVNVEVKKNGDTAVIEFEPVFGAKDYRIYPEPADPSAWLIGDNGEVGVKNGIYRCAGDRVFQPRELDDANLFDCAITGCDNTRHNYNRTEEEAVLGFVFLTPGPDRLPVYRLADPNGGGGFRNADWLAPIYPEANSAEYVSDLARRDELLKQGYRDDGIVFYTAKDAPRPVYRIKYTQEADWQGDNVVLYFTDGPEYDERSTQPQEDIADFGERFTILDTEEPGSVALHRLSYPPFDVLAAGEARFDLALHQGGRPINAVSWPGIKGKTRFIVEALDQGCPFPNGYINAMHVDADVDRTSGEPFNQPSITLDEARLSSGEVFINGQHEPNNRPKPVARAYVDVTPDPKPEMDFLETFDEGAEWEPFTKWQDNNCFVLRNSKWAIDTSGCTDNFAYGPLLGQFVLGFADGGSSCNVSMTPKNVPTAIAADRFLHVRMSTDIPSTNRRYPQIMITDRPLYDDPGPDEGNFFDVPVHNRLGKLSFQLSGPDGQEGTADDEPAEGGQTIVVQPFAGYQETQIEYCDKRGWGVSQQCPRANVYGHHAGDYTEEWEQSWTPVPVQGAMAGYDRPVKWDVYASTSRVYVFMDDKPAACAVLPQGRMPVGPVTVAYRAVLYHCGIDEASDPKSGHQYEHNYSLCHSDHHMDDFGIELSAPEPAWDESVLPCGTKWYGGG
jgi:hypothetical protein